LKGGWVPVLVRDDPGAPAGNRALLSLGAARLSTASIGGAIGVAELVALGGESGRNVAEAASLYTQSGLFDDLGG
jgi:hypothetical protein